MLPKTLKYGSKIESAYARSMRSNIQPQNGTGPYNLGDTVIINIPTRANLILVSSESYLKFNITVTNNANAGNAFRWDSCGAHGIIQRIRVFHGSNLLSDIDNYAMLTKMLFDIQMPTDATYGKYNVLSGTRSDLVGRLPTFITINQAGADVAVATANSANFVLNAATLAGVPVTQINSGDRIEGNGALVAAAGTTIATYCLSLVSLVGLLCSQIISHCLK